MLIRDIYNWNIIHYTLKRSRMTKAFKITHIKINSILREFSLLSFGVTVAVVSGQTRATSTLI